MIHTSADFIQLGSAKSYTPCTLLAVTAWAYQIIVGRKCGTISEIGGYSSAGVEKSSAGVEIWSRVESTPAQVTNLTRVLHPLNFFYTRSTFTRRTSQHAVARVKSHRIAYSLYICSTHSLCIPDIFARATQKFHRRCPQVPSVCSAHSLPWLLGTATHPGRVSPAYAQRIPCIGRAEHLLHRASTYPGRISPAYARPIRYLDRAEHPSHRASTYTGRISPAYAPSICCLWHLSVCSVWLLFGSVQLHRMNQDEAREDISRWLNGINVSIFTAYSEHMLSKC